MHMVIVFEPQSSTLPKQVNLVKQCEIQEIEENFLKSAKCREIIQNPLSTGESFKISQNPLSTRDFPKSLILTILLDLGHRRLGRRKSYAYAYSFRAAKLDFAKTAKSGEIMQNRRNQGKSPKIH